MLAHKISVDISRMPYFNSLIAAPQRTMIFVNKNTNSQRAIDTTIDWNGDCVATIE